VLHFGQRREISPAECWRWNANPPRDTRITASIRLACVFSITLPLYNQKVIINPVMSWNVEYTDEFGDWWTTLDESEQDSIAVTVTLLENKGPYLPYPYSSGIEGSKHDHMRELRIQHKGDPYRVLYAFDPRRSAIY
jgi:mRNA-degrading endonuclease RelE of RelBE toxin-antitoxin system